MLYGVKAGSFNRDSTIYVDNNSLWAEENRHCVDTSSISASVFGPVYLAIIW